MKSIHTRDLASMNLTPVYEIERTMLGTLAISAVDFASEHARI